MIDHEEVANVGGTEKQTAERIETTARRHSALPNYFSTRATGLMTDSAELP
jgi:hypothetical protein